MTLPAKAGYVVGLSLGFGGTSLGTILLAVFVAVSQWWQARKIREVHIIVNSQKTAMQNKIGALRAQLTIAQASTTEETQ